MELEMLKNLIKKCLYKKYQKGLIRITTTCYPDHIADCLDREQVIDLKFNSGNTYNCRFLKWEYGSSDLAIGYYEITNDIQELTFEQFSNFNISQMKSIKEK